MAEAIILNITKKILGELVSLAVKEVGKKWGVDEELEKLKETVLTLQAVLLDAEKQYYQSHQIKIWLQRLKDLLYDAQDVLEECNIEALRQELKSRNGMMKQVCTFFTPSNQLAFKSKMSRKVKGIRERMESIAADKRFHLEEQYRDGHVDIESEESMREKTHSFACKEDIIGRDDARERIVRLLLDTSVKENVSVIPIAGTGGLGKTALAKCIYNDAMVEKHFDLRIWVCVSNEFLVKKVVRDILESATKKRPDDVEIDQLQKSLREKIDGKKYLLVLDDVWNEDRERWMSLKGLLMGGAKLLITTRFPLVGEIVGTISPYLLESLSDSISLDLLMRLACKEEETTDLEKLSIAKEIVKTCCAVPLAIRTIGSLLFSKKTVAERRHFTDHELLEVSRKVDGINSILKLNYDHLPSHLKQCFAFCSLFPKDYEIDKQKLMSLWMAEGFIVQMNGSTRHLEDIPNDYFTNLLSRNFFQDVKNDHLGYVRTCKMHDLACLVAGTECAIISDSTRPVHERTRHVCHDPLVGFPHELFNRMCRAKKLRTFIVVNRFTWEG